MQHVVLNYERRHRSENVLSFGGSATCGHGSGTLGVGIFFGYQLSSSTRHKDSESEKMSMMD